MKSLGKDNIWGGRARDSCYKMMKIWEGMLGEQAGGLLKN
jgi:hypothetical protein